MNRILLGVNIDHIATLRNARRTIYPDPIQAAFIAEQYGADSITVHLREDRRHINDRDINILCQTLNVNLNLEMAITEEMITLASKIKPHSCCFVPEKRQELTTESGLDIIKEREKIYDAYKYLAKSGIKVSLFIDPNEQQIKAASEIGVPYVELHTGYYADAKNDKLNIELNKIIKSANLATSLGLNVKAGHGLNYHNVQEIAKISSICELNIGHAIISRAVISGLKEAIISMKNMILETRQ